MSEPRVLSTPIALPRAARRAAEGGPAAAWYEPVPRDTAGWRARAHAVRDAFAGSAWAEALEPALDPSGPAAARLERVLEGGGLVVTTGQQAGLFGGPIYTWSKALSAIALADALEDVLDVPVAPVYWAATYDADFAEAASTHVAVDGRVVTLTMPAPAAPGRRMADTPLGDVSPLLDELAGAAGAALAPHVLDTVRRAYAPGATVGSAFVALLRAILEPLGMPVLDAGHPAVQAAERPLMERALVRAAGVDSALAARDAELRAQGVSPQVDHVPGLSLVFAAGAAERRRLPLGTEPAAAREPLEPNVLLRPVAERAILPTVAYVAGPGELAYFAQSTAVAAALDAAPPLAVPRWSGVIVEPHVERVLDRYRLGVDDLRDPHAALGRLVRARVPSSIATALEHYREALDEAAINLAQALGGTQPPLLPEAVVEGARRSLAHRLDRLERRVVAATKRRETELAHHIAVARAALFPLDHAQERTANLMPLLARHGPMLLDAMLDRARAHVETLGLPVARTALVPEAGGGR